MTRLALRAFVLAASSVVLVEVAAAGLLDSPPPTLPSGGTSRVVYRLGPVNHSPPDAAGGVETVVRCTNLSAGTIDIALEIFDQQDVRVGIAIRAGVGAGAAVEFITAPAAEFPAAQAVPGLPLVAFGKARVSTTTTQLGCEALHAIRSRNAGSPIRLSAVELVKKVAVGN